MKKLLTGLFRHTSRKVGLTTDGDVGKFRQGLTALVNKKDSFTDDAVAKSVDELKAMASDLPDTDDKSKLLRFLEDFKAVKEQDPKIAEDAAKSVADLFEKLDTEAMKDAPETIAAPASPTGDSQPPATVEKKEPVKDAEPTGNGTDKKDNVPQNEEIYQFVKKRLAEDAEADKAADEKRKEPNNGVVADRAIPVVPVNLVDSNPTKGGLDDLFMAVKKRS